MPTRMLVPVPAPPVAAGRALRIEYLDFLDAQGHREYRFRVHRAEGWSEVRSRISAAAFAARLVRISDGPDLCYQKLLRAMADGAPPPDVITTDEADFVSYRDEHTPVPKRRASSRPPAPAQPAEPRPRPPYRPRPAKVAKPAAAPPVETVAEPTLEEGQRVSHSTFGMGVTTTTTRTRTVVSFDQGGPRSFVASMLEVEILSAPHTWETSARGVNRPRRSPDEPGDSPTAP